MAEILIAAKADVHTKNSVTASGTPSLLLIMLVDGQLGVTPLHLAASYSQVEVAEILIAAGADMDAKNIVTAPCAFLLLIMLTDRLQIPLWPMLKMVGNVSWCNFSQLDLFSVTFTFPQQQPYGQQFLQ